MIARFRLDGHFQRPVINLEHQGEVYLSLIDTGANIPVFTLGRRKMEALGGRFVKERVRFGSFGGTCGGALYRMDMDFGPFRYVDLPVVCTHNTNMRFAFILSATMFTGFSYTIDNHAHTLTVDTRTDEPALRFRVEDGAGGFHVLVEISHESHEFK